MKISGVYEIINTITGDFYIGSTINLERRRREHFNESHWKQNQNKPLYKYMQQYGKDNFLFKPIWLCESDELKEYEQIAIEKYNPKYNIRDAYTGLSKEEYQKQYHKENADSIKQYQKQYKKQYYTENTDKIKQYNKQYYKENTDKIKQYYKENTDKIKQYRKENADSIKQYQKQYNKKHADSIKQYKKQYYKENADSIKQQKKQYDNQQCLYENEILSLCALRVRFARKGIQHPTLEAKKYLIKLP